MADRTYLQELELFSTEISNVTMISFPLWVVKVCPTSDFSG